MFQIPLNPLRNPHVHTKRVHNLIPWSCSGQSSDKHLLGNSLEKNKMIYTTNLLGLF